MRALIVSVILATTATAAAALAPLANVPTTVTPYCASSVDGPETMICAASQGELNRAWNESDLSETSTVLIAILYDNANMDGSAGSWAIYAGAQCTTSVSNIDYSISDLGSWRDRVSSFQSYGNCATRLWSGTGFGGTAYPSATGWAVSATYVGAAFNDKARSAQFS